MGVDDLETLVGHRQYAPRGQVLGLARDAVDADPVAAAKVPYAPAAVDPLQLTVPCRDGGAPDHDIAVVVPADDEAHLA
jgi:hypothetical protein